MSKDVEHAATELAATEEVSAQTEPRGDGPIAVKRHFIGRFRIDAELGSGGMADVYRAYDPLLDRAVALKVLHARRSADDTQGMRRVLREARAAAALTHPNTVTIFEVGEADGEVFIAMELLEGSVLREVLDRGTASLEEKLRWLLQAARALGAAHTRGLVHRDVKPENMFVCADGSLKLLDFGIAKREADDDMEGAPEHAAPSSLRTQAGRRLGTPRYMAPEQHAGLATDARTDEYAWGLVAFEMLCGSNVVAEQPTATMEGGAAPAGASSAMRLAELRVKAPELPEAVAACIARALEPSKEARFPSMEPIAAALESQSKADTPAPPRPSRARPQLLLLVTAAALSAFAMLGIVRRRQIWAWAQVLSGAVPEGTSQVAPALPPACRTVSTRFLQMGLSDRMVVLPNGDLVFSRDPERGLMLERETPEGVVPFMDSRLSRQPDLGVAILNLQGTMSDGVPAVAIVQAFLERTTLGTVQRGNVALALVRSGGRPGLKSLGIAPEGFTTTSFGHGTVTIVTSGPAEREDVPAGVAAHVLGNDRVAAIETGVAHAPAAAATRDRLGIAYQLGAETHFALLDEQLQRVGDITTALPFVAETAVAFAGTTAALFWTDARSGKTRLQYTTVTSGEASTAAPRIAIDEALVNARPITARLPDGSFAVAWLTSTGGAPTLRVSPIGEGGALTGPSNVATDQMFRDLRAAPTPQGIDFSWHDDAGGARLAHVTCQPPTSRPDR